MRRRVAAPLLAALLLAAWLGTSMQSESESATPSETRALPPAPRTQVVLLGTGTPVPDPRRSGPALAIVVDGVPYLVDCGPGVVRRAAAAWERGVSGLDPTRLGRLFVTHLHSDHTTGLADLLLAPWVVGRREPLQIWGPKGVAQMAERVRSAYVQDIEMRTEGFEGKDPAGGTFVAHELEAGDELVTVLDDGRVVVEAIPVEHGSWKHAFGYRFTTPDRTVVVSGDARPSPLLREASRGVDILVHEVYSLERFREGPPSFQRYHGSFHTSTRDLARIAAEARPALLVLTHQLYWGASDDDLLREIAEVYDGPVVSGQDLDVF